MHPTGIEKWAVLGPRARGMRPIARRVASGLSLAAAPIFAIMALLTLVPADGPLAMTCLGGNQVSPFDSMGLMYLLMGVFHLSPWIKRIAFRGDT